jgi:WD40 repeat protein
VFSGSRDGTIRLWDQRQAKSAAVVGLGQQGPRRASEDGMITCIHAAGCLLASGALDSRLRLWDLRNLATPSFNLNVDDSPILKVSLSPLSTSSYPIIAVSTNSKSSLFLSFPAAG